MGEQLRRVGLIGKPVKHSISPVFQQAALDHLGIPARYEAWEVEPEDIPAFLQRVREPEWFGINVTVPHKLAVIPLLDELDERASRIGAVNTIVNRSGRLIGHNTDVDGLVRALRDAGFAVEGARAVLLGAGGAARAAAYGLVWAGVSRLVVLNRDVERARRLVAELAGIAQPGTCEAKPLLPEVARAEIAGAQLVVNSTSVGMRHGSGEGQSPVPDDALHTGLMVYDLVYTPAVTPLLAAADRAGARSLGGLPMLVYQGAVAFEIWTGQPAPIKTMSATAERAMSAR